MEDNGVTADPARRAGRHASMKSQVERDVNADIGERAEHTASAEAQAMDVVARRFRCKAEVIDFVFCEI